MLKSLHFQNFRGFRDVRVRSLKRVNLITGENDTGKTAFLEALYLLLSASSFQMNAFPGIFRNSHRNAQDDLQSFWEWLFYEGNAKIKLTVRADQDEGPAFFTHLSLSSGGQLEIDLGRGQVHESKIVIGSHGGGQTNVTDRPKVLTQSTRLGEPVNDAELYNRVSLTAGGEERILYLMR